MTTLVWVYIVVYALFWISASVIDSVFCKPEERDPLWEQILDGVMIVCAFFGMLLYQRAPDLPDLRVAWQIVVVALGVVHAAMLLRAGRFFFGSDGVVHDDERSSSVWLGLALSAFMIVPSLWLNVLYAFG